MDISVLLATYRRADILLQTLESFCLLNTGTLEWEILVVDNADDERTRQLIERYSDKLPIRYLLETKRGKNNAINKAIPEAKGTLFVFTDDDIIADPRWLVEMWEGSDRWPEYAVFGGRILPKFPIDHTLLKPDNPFFKHAYAVADWALDEGQYSAHKVWGPNMAIRAQIFKKEWRFNEDLGPKGENYITGGETELTVRLEKAGIRSIYLPKAVVLHQISSQQMQSKWLCKRAFRYGRYCAFMSGSRNVPYLFGAPRPLYRALLETCIKQALSWSDRDKNLDLKLKCWQLRGMIFQYRKGLPRIN